MDAPGPRPPRPALDLTAVAKPAMGGMAELAPGVFWLRFTLPAGFDHVNSWALADGDGWTLVDCGLDRPDIRVAWEELLAGPLAGKPVRRLVLTHAHPDHLGIAGMLTRRFHIPFVATRGEWMQARLRYLETFQDWSPATAQFLFQHGYDRTEARRQAEQRIGASPYATTPPPESFSCVADGETLIMGGRRWRVIVGTGHSLEHAAYYCDELRVLIAGDEVLEAITPIIGVWAGEPEADPLAEYFASLARYKDLPTDTLVLPSHGLPFRGLHARVQTTEDHHWRRLARLHGLLTAPKTALALAGELFPRAAAKGHLRLALAETIAHLHWLAARGLAAAQDDAGGVRRFTARGSWAASPFAGKAA